MIASFVLILARLNKCNVVCVSVVQRGHSGHRRLSVSVLRCSFMGRMCVVMYILVLKSECDVLCCL